MASDGRTTPHTKHNRSFARTSLGASSSHSLAVPAECDETIFEMLADSAAQMVADIAVRSWSTFGVFVRITAKALVSTSRADENKFRGKRHLKTVLLHRNTNMASKLLDLKEQEVNKLLIHGLALGSMGTDMVRDIRIRNIGQGSDTPVRMSASHDAPAESNVLVQQDSQRASTPRMRILEDRLFQKWEFDENYTEEDWEQWRSELESELFFQSGSPALRACSRLVEIYPKFARSLFNAAFLSCWVRLPSAAQGKTVLFLEKALNSETMPLIGTQALLNLFEYMDHDEKSLPVAGPLLAKAACRCGAYAKALRYAEGHYIGLQNSRDDGDFLYSAEELTAIYEKLGHMQSAEGTKRHARRPRGSQICVIPKDPSEDIDLPLQQHPVAEWRSRLRQWITTWDNKLLGQRRQAAGGSTYSESKQTDEVLSDAAIFSTLASKGVQSKYWDVVIEELRALDQEGKWRTTNELLTRVWPFADETGRSRLSLDGKGVSVAFDLGNWKQFEERVKESKEDTFYGAFYRALLLARYGKVNPNNLPRAEKYLEYARSRLDLDLTAKLSEGYPRAYMEVVHSQILVELGEMIAFLRMPSREKAYGKRHLQAVWDQRLVGCKYDRFVWYRLLMIRATVLPPLELKERWMEFAAMCRKTHKLPLASEALRMLVSPIEDFCHEPGRDTNVNLVRTEEIETRLEDWSMEAVTAVKDLEIRFACLRHIWAAGRELEAYRALKNCASDYRAGVVNMSSGDCSSQVSSEWMRSRASRDEIIAGKVFLKLSKWCGRLLAKGVGNSDVSLALAIEFAAESARIRPNCYKAWHSWATHNAERAEQLINGMRSDSVLTSYSASMSNAGSCKTRTSSTASDRSSHGREPAALRPARTVLNREGKQFLTQAVSGFFQAIKLGGKTRLEDTLKVLTLWFKYGAVANMHKEFDKGFRETVVAMWLEVVPQIIARLQISYRGVQAGIEQLLTRIGEEHPQAAVYPLTVAKTSPGPFPKRREAAERVLERIKRRHEKIVTQAEMVSHELVRVAILLSETWYEKLEEASRILFEQKNVDGMLECLLPLHQALEQGPQTAYERSFVAECGSELNRAGAFAQQIAEERRRNRTFQEIFALGCQAWDIYYQVYGRLRRQTQLMRVLDLSEVSDELWKASDLELAVPGTYDPAIDGVVTLKSFRSQLHVIQSKQRPRKLVILGNDGNEYTFLLKGHEDLRQDERVMQVFGLINKLLAKSAERSIRHGVDLKRYAVVALSSNAGLIEWVPELDTMHALVKEYREAKKIMLNIEQKVMLQAAPKPDDLPLLHKVDIFERMLLNTDGIDIAQVLWLRSRSSEMWLDRRTAYARSLASSSMVGYLLGLGDRHPSNIMLERSSGKVMHVDFGDCFEVAMSRSKYSEKVPFRLTRMLVNALEPCGVDGYFRHTSEAVMRVLRGQNTWECLMSMMEAFVHDPLLKAKLVAGEDLQQYRQEDEQSRDAIISAFDNVRRGLAIPLISESLRDAEQNHVPSKEVSSLMQTGSLEASLRLNVLDDETVPGSIPTGTRAISQGPVDVIPMPSPSMASRQYRDRLMSLLPPETCNAIADEKAVLAVQRVRDKLHGRDFDRSVELSVEAQVQRLIEEAQSIENLCTLFFGWCAFW